MMSFYAVALMLIIVYVYRSLHVGRFGIRQLYFIAILCVVRLAIPVEFTFSKEVALGKLYNKAIPFLFDSFFGPLCVADWLAILWGLIAILLITRSFVKNKKFKNMILQCATPADDRYEQLLQKIRGRYKTSKKVKVIESRVSTTPFTFGFFDKIIVLPEGLSETQAYYSLLHEYGHIVRRDIEAIMLTDLFCNIMWWNPFAYLLRARMEETLELNCDSTVVGVIESAEKADYLQTIVAMIKRSEWKNSKGLASSLGLIRFNNNRFIVKRFKNVQDNSPLRRNVIYNAALALVCAGVFVSSYAFVFQSYFEQPNNDEYGYEINEESYIVLHDGVYELYNAGEYQYSLPSEKSALQMMERLGVPLRNEE